MTPNSSFTNASAGRGRGFINRTLDATNKQHLLAGVVAVLFALSALWYGGNPPEITAAISIVAWWTIILGAVFGLLPQGTLSRAAIAVLVLFTAVAALTALSITWASDEGRAFVKTVQITSYLGIFVLSLFSSRSGTARNWIAGVTGGLLVIVVLAAISRFIPGIGDDVELTSNLSGVQGRLSWPLGYWNAMGAAAAICAAGLTWFGVNARSVRLRSLAIGALPVTGLVIYLTSSRGAVAALLSSALILVCFGPQRRNLLTGLFAGLAGAAILIITAGQMNELVHADNNSTADQQGLILLALTLVVTAAVVFGWTRFESKVRDLAPWKPRGWQIAVGAVLILGALVAINPVDKVDQFLSPVPPGEIKPEEGENSTTSHLLSASGTGRSEYWGSAINGFESEPLRGIGAGGFENFYRLDRTSGLQGRHTHSLPLQILAELGIAGALLVLAILVVTILTAWQRWQAGRLSRSPVFAATRDNEEDPPWQAIPALLAIGAASAASLAIDWTAEFPVIVAPLLIAIMVIVGPATQSAVAGGRESVKDLGKDVLAALAIIAGGISIWVGASGFGLATNLNSSRDAVSNDDLALAASEARDAIDILPGASEPRIQLALVQELQGRYALALRTVNSAIERSPDTSSSYLLKARLLLQLDRDLQATKAYDKAESLDPRGLIFIEEPIDTDTIRQESRDEKDDSSDQSGSNGSDQSGSDQSDQ